LVVAKEQRTKNKEQNTFASLKVGVASARMLQPMRSKSEDVGWLL